MNKSPLIPLNIPLLDNNYPAVFDITLDIPWAIDTRLSNEDGVLEAAQLTLVMSPNTFLGSPTGP